MEYPQLQLGDPMSVGGPNVSCGIGVWTFSSKGIGHPAQGCCTQQPWERRQASAATPTGLWRSRPVHRTRGSPSTWHCRNPVGVARIISDPQGSRVRQPWALILNHYVVERPPAEGIHQLGLVVFPNGWRVRSARRLALVFAGCFSFYGIKELTNVRLRVSRTKDQAAHQSPQ